MAYIRNHFYIPDHNPVSIITQYIPARNFNIHDRLIMILTNYDTEYEIEFESIKGVNMLSQALNKLLIEKDNEPTDIKTFVVDKNNV